MMFVIHTADILFKQELSIDEDGRDRIHGYID